MHISDRKPISWIQYVDVHLDCEKFNIKFLEEQENKVVETIFKALNLIATEEQKPILASCFSVVK